MLRRIDGLVVAGLALLVVALLVSADNSKVLEHWYRWILGPALWMVGVVMVLLWLGARLSFIFRSKEKDTQTMAAKAPK